MYIYVCVISYIKVLNVSINGKIDKIKNTPIRSTNLALICKLNDKFQNSLYSYADHR